MLTNTMSIRDKINKYRFRIRSQKCLIVTLSCYCVLIIFFPCFTQWCQTGITNDALIIEEPSPNLKYILLWTRNDYCPFYYFGAGQEAFIRNNCSHTQCFVTSNRHQNLEIFHAIAFNGRSLLDVPKNLPKVRYPHQKYIYFNLESAPNQLVCNPLFDNFFNWTATYRLDSDIVSPYFRIKDWKGAIIGPKPNIEWKRDMKDLDDDHAKKLLSKSKAVASFASNCKTLIRRTEIIKALQLELSRYSLALDIYGYCGNLTCARSSAECDEMISKKYYFYLSFENSKDEDYVTEKLLRALQHDAVPIVLGGADYSRYLPPGSYLQAYNETLGDLAKKIAFLISNPNHYKAYFRWRSYYSYYDSKSSDNVCSLCAALSNQSMLSRQTLYRDFRKWWNPNYIHDCL